MLILKEEHVDEIIDILGIIYTKSLSKEKIDSEVRRLTQWGDRTIVKIQRDKAKVY